MASLMKKLKKIRANKLRNSGKTRKRALKAGTTPQFPVHVTEQTKSILPMAPGSDTE